MTEQEVLNPQILKAKVEFDFDSVACITLEVSGLSIGEICEKVDAIESQIYEWGEENFAEPMIDKLKNFLGHQTYRKRRKP